VGLCGGSLSLGQYAASDAFELSRPHGISEPPHSETVGHMLYSEGVDGAQNGVIPCGYIRVPDDPTSRALQVNLPTIPSCHGADMI
jgi:hypothetical protein